MILWDFARPPQLGRKDNRDEMMRGMLDRATLVRFVARLLFVLGVGSIAVTLILTTTFLPLLIILLLLVARYELRDAAAVAKLNALGPAASTDALTGLGNYRAFQSDIRREVARVSRRARPLSIAMIDIDDFKVINDSYGHAHGDYVLVKIGELMSHVRSEDRSYRLGGDEFSVIMPDTDVRAALDVMDRLRHLVIETMEGVTISVGVSSNLQHDRDALILSHQADVALYRAKHRGKNQVIAYDLHNAENDELTKVKRTA